MRNGFRNRDERFSRESENHIGHMRNFRNGLSNISSRGSKLIEKWVDKGELKINYNYSVQCPSI